MFFKMLRCPRARLFVLTVVVVIWIAIAYLYVGPPGRGRSLTLTTVIPKLRPRYPAGGLSNTGMQRNLRFGGTNNMKSNINGGVNFKHGIKTIKVGNNVYSEKDLEEDGYKKKRKDTRKSFVTPPVMLLHEDTTGEAPKGVPITGEMINSGGVRIFLPQWNPQGADAKVAGGEIKANIKSHSVNAAHGAGGVKQAAGRAQGRDGLGGLDRRVAVNYTGSLGQNRDQNHHSERNRQPKEHTKRVRASSSRDSEFDQKNSNIRDGVYISQNGAKTRIRATHIRMGKRQSHFNKSYALSPHDHYVVPNIFHFIRFNRTNMTFVEMLAIKSVILNSNPDMVFIHCDFPPTGPYWAMIKHHAKIQTKFVFRPREIFGRKIMYIHHAADIVRIEILLKFGGIYLDNDMFVIRSFDRLRVYDFTVAWHKDEKSMGNMILIGSKDSQFLKMYYNSYRNFQPLAWYFNAGDYPTEAIIKRYPNLVHVEDDLMGIHQPVMTELYDTQNMAPGERVDWRRYTAIHLYYNHRGYIFNDTVKQHGPGHIANLNNAFGEICRWLYARKI